MTHIHPEVEPGRADITSITDAGLLDLLALEESKLASNKPAFETLGQLKEAIEEYRTRRDVIVTPQGETLDNPELVRVSRIIAEAATTFEDTVQEDVEAGLFEKLFPTATSMRGKASRLLNALHANGIDHDHFENDVRFTQDRSGKKGLVVDAIPQIEELTAARSNGDEPTVPLLLARKQLKPLHEFVDEADTRHSINGPQMPEIIQGLPSKATIDYMVATAYVDILNSLKLYEDRVDSVIGRARFEHLRESGASEETLLRYGAAAILDLAILSKNGNDFRAELGRNGELMKALGKSSFIKRYKIASFAQKPNTKLPPGDLLIVNAHEVMVEILASEGARQAVEWFTYDKIEGANGYVKHIGHDLPESFAGQQDGFYNRLFERLNQADVSEDLVLEALQLEDYVIAQNRLMVHDLQAAGVLVNGNLAQVEQALEPRLANYLLAVDENQRLEELNGYFEQVKQRIAEIEQPYIFSAKRIRAFEDGPGLLRGISGELDVHDWLRETDTREALAMLVLQSETAQEREAFYEKLKQDRSDIEALLADMHYFGAEHKVSLIRALEWVDEIIDAGLDSTIGHERLQKFVLEYYLGPEEPIIDLTVEETQPEPMPEEPYPTDEIEDIDTIFNPAVEDIAVQLEWEVLPFGNLEDVIREIKRYYPADELALIDWHRIEDLVDLQQQTEGELYRSKHNSLGTRQPYFVLKFEHNDSTYAVAENPQYGNATYVLREDLTLGTWQEVLELAKRESRKLGAKRIYHTRPQEHKEKIIRALQDLATIRV